MNYLNPALMDTIVLQNAGISRRKNNEAVNPFQKEVQEPLPKKQCRVDKRFLPEANLSEFSQALETVFAVELSAGFTLIAGVVLHLPEESQRAEKPVIIGRKGNRYAQPPGAENQSQGQREDIMDVQNIRSDSFQGPVRGDASDRVKREQGSFYLPQWLPDSCRQIILSGWNSEEAKALLRILDRFGGQNRNFVALINEKFSQPVACLFSATPAPVVAGEIIGGVADFHKENGITDC